MNKFIENGFYVLISVGVFIFIIGFYVKNYNLYFILVGGVVLLITFVVVILWDRKEINALNNDYDNWKNILITQGIKIEVDLNKVDIKSSNYREEIIGEGYSEQSKYKALDTFTEKDNQEYSNSQECVLIYETESLENKFKFYSSIIPKDKTTLQFLLMNQKKTFIYQDKTDKNNYFFDIEFLYE